MIRKTVQIILIAALAGMAGCGTTGSYSAQEAEAANTAEGPETAAAPAAPPSPYFSGDGGKGMSIAILAPRASGLTENQGYIPALVQGEFVSNFSGYTALTVMDRENLDKVYGELLSGYYDEQDAAGFDLGHLKATDYLLTGAITRTGAGYALQMQITKTADKTTPASYSGTCTFAELDDLTGVRRASLELFKKIGITPTEQSRNELTAAAAVNHAQAQTALARGIDAKQKGTEITAASYYYQAAVLDPSLFEAKNRSSVASASISSGNIGDDTRNLIQWRKDWITRITETGQYFDNLFNNTPTPPYGLFYLTELDRGNIDYARESASLSFKLNFHSFPIWFDLVPASVLQDIRKGLEATKKAGEWGLTSWPRQPVTGLNPFRDRRNDFAVVFELVNDRGKVIGRQSITLRGSWGFSFSSDSVSLHFEENNFQTVRFDAVNANDITDKLTIRAASVNGASPQTVTQNGSLQIAPLSKNKWPANYEFNRGVITKYNGPGGQVRIPETIWGEPVKTIGNDAFSNKGLTGVTIPNTVTSIGTSAFANNQLTGVTIPNSVISIGDYAFADNRLTDSLITISKSVTSLGASAFARNRLTYDFDDGVITKYNGPGGQVSIPETIWNIPVKAIGNDAFRNKGITGVIIPNSVISIGLRAFGGNKLTSITIQDRVTPITFERSCGDAENISIVIGAGVTLDGDPMDHSYGGQHQKDFWKWPSKFKEYYEKNSRKAGTYTGKRVKWPQAVATSGRITYQSPGYRWSFKLR